ncbi:GNAT family N-acetyltransferase [Dokdonia ponticola]|uniref:GNAT family N-acetyltransferase n=1 Tax=Dokdonia ponticola TaxID=2041041 RepID=A0ABV9I1X7_9FLAO
MCHHFSELNPIITTRLQLRVPCREDREPLLFMRSDPEVNKYIMRKPPISLEEIDVFISDRLKDRKEGNSIYWVLAPKEASSKCIGAISLWHFSDDRKTAEVGYDLDPTYQGKGYMSEALTAVLEFGFKTLDLATIEAYTHVDNIPSRTLLERHAFMITNKKDASVPTNVVYSLSVI